MTKDDAEKARTEVAELIAAVIRFAQDLDLTAAQTAAGIVDALAQCPRATRSAACSPRARGGEAVP
jgi:hypothetical protein